ncbi:MAG: muropeptide transporter AmpG [Betaproteobacteria bacterium RIFCSPLOWO2_02_FULL_67_26]|nr:MAG: muropeptide transporter AmpG [Betaproteobacteria bacterium RIFCSPLOWO2_02_FULL_67_26]
MSDNPSPKGARAPYLEVFGNRRILAVLLLGFSSGLPLALTAGTLQAWLAVESVDIKTIGLFTLAGQPYAYKFLWAPLMDRYVPPFLGRRRGWLVVTQVALLAAIALMGTLSPRESPWLMGGVALAVAFLSASQDIVFDAYRTDVLREPERGAGAAISVLGYRIAMLVSGGLALVLADQLLGWSGMYFLMAGLMAVGMVTAWFAPEPEEAGRAPGTLAAAYSEPLKEFFTREGAWLILLLIVLYKLGDAFAGSLTTAFLIQGAGFSATDVGAINKALGLAATIGGALLGGAWMAGLGLFRALMLFGILQAVTNLGFMLLAMAGKSYPLMIAAIAAENLCGGMGTAAFVALLMTLCDHRYSATQYALLSALAAVGRVYVGPVSGVTVAAIGWAPFFFLTFVVALPGLVLLWWLRARLAPAARYPLVQKEQRE